MGESRAKSQLPQTTGVIKSFGMPTRVMYSGHRHHLSDLQSSVVGASSHFDSRGATDPAEEELVHTHNTCTGMQTDRLERLRRGHWAQVVHSTTPG